MVLAISSLTNFVSIHYHLALAWHTIAGHVACFALDDVPQPSNWLCYALHTLAYTAVVFLTVIFGERHTGAKAVMLASQRVLEQQALERWRMQKEAQTEGMLHEACR